MVVLALLPGGAGVSGEMTIRMKHCTKCGLQKPLDAFNRKASNRDGRRAQCRDCQKESGRSYYAANREEILRYFAENRDRLRPSRRKGKRKYARRTAREIRMAVFDHYGWACKCCGTSENLVIDHVNGDGRQHREQIFGKAQGSGTRFHRWLAQQGFPSEGYQTLCLRCNSSKASGDRCRIDHKGVRPCRG